MKKIGFILTSVVCIVLVFGGTTITREESPVPAKKICRGYDIIEAGKGVNCNGDTIKLTKRSGFYEVDSSAPKTLEAGF